MIHTSTLSGVVPERFNSENCVQSVFHLQGELMAACSPTSGKHWLHHFLMSQMFNYLRSMKGRHVSFGEKIASGQITGQGNAWTSNLLSIKQLQNQPKTFRKASDRRWPVQRACSSKIWTLFIIIVKHKSSAALDYLSISWGYFYMLTMWLWLAWDGEQDKAYVGGCGW